MISRVLKGGDRLKIWPFALLCVTVLFAPSAVGSETRDPDRYFFDQTFGDLRQELENAQKQGKKGILVMFERDECPFCYRMKTEVLNQPTVQDLYKKHFLVFSVDIEGDLELIDFRGKVVAEKDFALEQLRVRATPVFSFFGLDGKLIIRYTGATKDEEEFFLLGQYVVDGVYKEKSFSRYKREQREVR